MTGIKRALGAWFRRNRREMPWRVTRDPYRIWISEVMLQQTRVAAVLPYYARFLRRFPNVRALARARSEEVLRLWAGLGYYRRARHLHRAAKEIVERHGGRFPRDYDAALALPGIGRYTAAAILSIAYGQPLAVLDGNVARVLARLGAVRGDLRAPRRWKQLAKSAQQLLDASAPGDWNQAMMELGATVCTPRRPRCAECPLARVCKAYKKGIAEELPPARKKRATVRVRIAAAVLLDAKGRTLLVRQKGGLFSGMWQFPAVEVRRDPRAELGEHWQQLCRNGRGNPTPRRRGRGENAEKWDALPSAKHRVTFRAITLAPFLVRVPRLPVVDGARAIRLAQIEQLPISNATRKIAEAAGMPHTGLE